MHLPTQLKVEREKKSGNDWKMDWEGSQMVTKLVNRDGRKVK